MTMRSITTAFRPGWLVFAGNLGGSDAAVCGEAWAVNLSVEHSAWSHSVRLDAELRDAVMFHGKPPEQHLWEALQHWPQPGTKDGRRWPAEMEALLALARRHPEEYEELRQGEAVLRALGG
jgi:hypothetical protein